MRYREGKKKERERQWETEAQNSETATERDIKGHKVSKRERESRQGGSREGGRREREPSWRKKGEKEKVKMRKGPIGGDRNWQRNDRMGPEREAEGRQEQAERPRQTLGIEDTLLSSGRNDLPPSAARTPPHPYPAPQYQLEIKDGGIWCKYSSFRTEPLMYSKKLFSCGLLCMLLISLLQILLFSEVPGDPLTTDFYGKEVG